MANKQSENHLGETLRVNFIRRENGPERLVCEAELVFLAGPLADMKLVGFCLWRGADGERKPPCRTSSSRDGSCRDIAALHSVAGPRWLRLRHLAGEQVAPRASRPSRRAGRLPLRDGFVGTPRAGCRGCALRSLWSLRPIILVDYRQPRALARGDAPLWEAARGSVLARSRGLHVG